MVDVAPSLNPDESLSPRPTLQNVRAVSPGSEESESSPAWPNSLTFPTAVRTSVACVIIASLF